jgi:hypothetical protein
MDGDSKLRNGDSNSKNRPSVLYYMKKYYTSKNLKSKLGVAGESMG